MGGANSQAIEFGTYVGRDAQVRSANAITSIDDLQGKGFGVFAFYTEQKDFADAGITTPNFMNNQKVEYTSGAWTYSPLKYWPNNTGDKVSFFAYAPYDASKTWNADKIAYTVENDVKDQVDLLFAPAQANKTKQGINDKITFAFKHALARIGFSVAYAADELTPGDERIDANTKITINKIVLRKKDATPDADGVFYKKGNLTLTAADADADAAWANQDGAQAFTLLPANFTATELNNGTANISPLNASDSYVMIIPQNTEFEVYVEYTVTTTDASLTGGKSEITNKITTAVDPIDFKANKSYTLNLVLGMTSVKVDAEFTDWDTTTEAKDVDVPANK